MNDHRNSQRTNVLSFGRLTTEHGYMSLVVDVEELRRLVRGRTTAASPPP